MHSESKTCPGCGCIKVPEMEVFIYEAMVKKLKGFRTLTGRKKGVKANPKLTAKQLELAQAESEIEKLVDTLTGAAPVLLSYVNENWGTGQPPSIPRRRNCEADRRSGVPGKDGDDFKLFGDWENVSFDDKRQVVDGLITVIRATNEKVEIEWKI